MKTNSSWYACNFPPSSIFLEKKKSYLTYSIIFIYVVMLFKIKLKLIGFKLNYILYNIGKITSTTLVIVHFPTVSYNDIINYAYIYIYIYILVSLREWYLGFFLRKFLFWRQQALFLLVQKKILEKSL